MCGICGICYQDENRPVDSSLLKAMTDIIQHRGPDDEGWYVDGFLGLGSRRLSIVGLNDGHMPMSTKEKDLWVVYNGELYNHPHLKEKLTAKGHHYRTRSDTETFLYLYREYGEDFLLPVRGMFALALWDRKKQKLILARDRLGIKPLFYQLDDKALRFASEIKCLLCDPEVKRELDYDALNHYLCYLAAPEPLTMFRGIKKLMPGEMLVWTPQTVNHRMYWEPNEWIQKNDVSTDEIKKELVERLEDVVDEHLLSDVPVGAFLSGGIDSSVLVALMHRIIGPGFKTFSIGFEGHKLFDETPQARLIAKQFETDHQEKILNPNDLLNALDDITWQLDEPLADSSCLPVYFVSKLASESVKVVLSGDGGDEIFAGYRKYQAEYFRRYLSWMPNAALKTISNTLMPMIPESRSGYWMDLLRQVKKFFRGVNPDPFERHRGWAIHFEDAHRKALLNPDVLESIEFETPQISRKALFDQLPHHDDLTRMLWVDLRLGLPADMLTKVDRMSMLHSLEVRVPFLDHELVEYAFSLPGHLKLNGKQTKWILKEAFKDLLPDSILYRRKHGFDVPVGEWFRGDLRDMIEDVCSEATTSRRGLFNPRQIRSLIMDHQDGKRDYNNHLWMLLSLELWQRRYLDPPAGKVPARPALPESL